MIVSGIVIFVLVLMLLIKIKCYKNILSKPGCYGHYRAGDSRALRGCEDCELEYECEQTAKGRWGMVMKTSDLKPCPFCGAKPIVYEIEPREHSIVGLPKFDGAYVVECPLCNVGFTGETLEDVLYSWNRRETK